MERCCANCDWCISLENEEDILRGQDYIESDPLRPKAGDCSLGKKSQNFLCDEFVFISNLLDDVKKEIMEQNRHQFIYGYNTKARSVFLSELEYTYPIKINENSPMAIYLEDFCLPNIGVEDLELYQGINVLSEEYLNYAIIYEILNRFSKIKQIDLIEAKILKLIDSFNILYLNKDLGKMQTLEDLLKNLKDTKEIYYKYYMEKLAGKSILPNLNDTALSFLDLSCCIKNIKQTLDNESHFSLIIDYQKDLSNLSKKTINSLINRRCNKDISMKIACEPNDWLLYYDLNNDLIEYIHDYDIVQFDESYVNSRKR